MDNELIEIEEEAKFALSKMSINEIESKLINNCVKQNDVLEMAKEYVLSLNLKHNVDEYKEYAIQDFIAGYNSAQLSKEEDPKKCKHETILGGDGCFYCADCGAGK